MKILLQHKIFIGYFLLMAIIGSMVAIVLHERSRVQKIENESIAIFQTQHNINTTHRYVTTLVTYGESVMVWNDEDSGAYRERRVRTDSMLQTLRTQCKDFIQPEQIDSLRTLLAAKEDHLFQIMEATREQKKTDSLLFHQKPTVTTQTTTRTVTRKKKGIAGIFGGKETVQMPVVTTRQTAPDKELISLLNKRKRDIETYTDSLRLCNRELNRKLRLLITSLDEQTWNAFRSKEERLKASYEHSTLVITGLIIFSIILLFISYLVIQRDIKVKAKNKKHLEETIEQNIALLEMRKNIILTISHDIRAPLNVISGSAELAVDTREKKRRNTHLNNIRIVCRHVVHLLNNLLGGTIDVTSGIDRGSTFRVTLPLKTTDETVESESLIIPHPAHLPRNVLVIDDDTMLLNVIKEMLERNGMNCTTCVTSKDVVKAMRGKDYDLLISDIQMPGTNGFDLLTLLRNSNIGNSRTIPIVAMTARGDKDKEAFLHAGFTDYIYKPFSSSELLGLLSRIKTNRREEKPEVDFSLILSEVSDKHKALLSLISQSDKDREELDAAMKNVDRQKLREIIHRMQPMWEFLRMEGPLLAYHTLLKNSKTSDKELNEHTRQIIDSTAMLIKAAEAEIKRLTNETEDTDS